MVMGGQAVLLFGEPRLTPDIDVTLGVGIDRLTSEAVNLSPDRARRPRCERGEEKARSHSPAYGKVLDKAQRRISAVAAMGGDRFTASQPSEEKGARIDEAIVEKEEKKGFRVGGINRLLLLRTRYFTDSGILGTKEFVSRHCRRFQDLFTRQRQEKRPRPVAGLVEVYSLKRLAEVAP